MPVKLAWSPVPASSTASLVQAKNVTSRRGKAKRSQRNSLKKRRTGRLSSASGSASFRNSPSYSLPVRRARLNESSPIGCGQDPAPTVAAIGNRRAIPMKNAHERFGWLEFEKQLRDTRTKIRVALDRFIGEPSDSKEVSGVCHLVSVFGSDVDIGAIWAAIAS